MGVETAEMEAQASGWTGLHKLGEPWRRYAVTFL
jgi:hypothetical protein